MNSPSPSPDFINNETLDYIRRNVDWQKVFTALGLQKEGKQNRDDDWWCRSPFNPTENTPSFHMNANPQGGGRWYCHSTKRGGGVLDLVQEMNGGHIYDAGRWLIDNGCCPEPPKFASGGDFNKKSDPTTRKAPKGAEASPERKNETPDKNKPIRQTLIPKMDMSGEDPEFERRGISANTLRYLGAGHLPADQKSTLKDRLVFQIRGINDLTSPTPKSTILTHMGRATSPEQAEEFGKWSYYKGFKKSLELYNIDNLCLDNKALQQIADRQQVIIVEGCFDVAKLIEADILNVIAVFGTEVSKPQIEKLEILKERLGFEEYLIWFDRSDIGPASQEVGLNLLEEAEIPATAFDWKQQFTSPQRTLVEFPDDIQDPCDFSAQQLKWLRKRNIV